MRNGMVFWMWMEKRKGREFRNSKYYTREETSLSDQWIVKRDGRVQKYDPQKLYVSLHALLMVKNSGLDPGDAEDVFGLVNNEVLRRFQQRERLPVHSRDIILLTLNILKEQGKYALPFSLLLVDYLRGSSKREDHMLLGEMTHAMRGLVEKTAT